MAETCRRRDDAQRAFAAWLRAPDSAPPLVDVDPARMAVYRTLFFSNVLGVLNQAFPVLKSLHTDTAWRARVDAFFREHRPQTPIFHQLPGEFVDWLAQPRPLQPAPPSTPDDPPFLAELAHYEWVELALMTAEDPPPAALLAEPNGDLLAGAPRLSPLAWPLVYRWPVHRIGVAFQPDTADATPTCLVVYRNRQDDVKFMEINPVTARLLELAEAEPALSGRALLGRIAAELPDVDPETVLASGAAMLEALRARGVLLGTRRSVD